MRSPNTVVELLRIDPRVLARLARIEDLCLMGGGLLGLVGLLSHLIPWHMIWSGMPVDAAAAALASAAGLEFARQQHFAGARTLSRLLAIPPAVAGIAGLATLARRSTGGASLIHAGPQIVPVLVALSFLFLAVVLVFGQTRRGKAAYIPDLAAFGLGAAVFSLLGARFFGLLGVFGDSISMPVGRPTVFALALLSFAAFSRRAEYGGFSIFLGHGIGSRITRGLLPILVILPYAREGMRAALVGPHRLPDRFAAALLASAAVMISVALLMLIGRHIRRMEGEIRDLTLRDELTGLYNLRGFQLLAEQAFRLARRSEQPFSVLFLDIDDLKQINDAYGHGAGSKLLAAAAEFLKSSFRETDVLGRVGGDEFAVAGQFSASAIRMVEERLQKDSSLGAEIDKVHLRLRVSMGYVIADPRRHETLEDLLDKADAAMYQQKRTRKLQAV